MYYLRKYDGGPLISRSGYHGLKLAKDAADALKAKTGTNYVVVKTEVVWSTKTMDEAMSETR